MKVALSTQLPDGGERLHWLAARQVCLAGRLVQLLLGRVKARRSWRLWRPVPDEDARDDKDGHRDAGHRVLQRVELIADGRLGRLRVANHHGRHDEAQRDAQLVAEHADAGGRGHLMIGKPDGGQQRRHTDDEELRQGHHRLASHHPPEVGARRFAAHLELDEGAQRRPCGAHTDGILEANPFEHHTCVYDERNVSYHEHQRGEIHLKVADTIIVRHDVGDARVLDPLERVDGRVGAKDGQHEPAPLVGVGGLAEPLTDGLL